MITTQSPFQKMCINKVFHNTKTVVFRSTSSLTLTSYLFHILFVCNAPSNERSSEAFIAALQGPELCPPLHSGGSRRVTQQTAALALSTTTTNERLNWGVSIKIKNIHFESEDFRIVPVLILSNRTVVYY